MPEFKFQIGDVVRLKSDTHVNCPKYTVLEQVAHTCHGGTQRSYVLIGHQQNEIRTQSVNEPALSLVGDGKAVETMVAANLLKEQLVGESLFEEAAELRNLIDTWKKRMDASRHPPAG